ncbi:MAG: hypothetical protein ABJA66_14260 [Actinomycetota bacterium]
MKKILFLAVAALISAACATSTTEVKNAANSTVANAPNNTETSKKAEFTAGANPKSDVISSTQKLQELEFWSAAISSETSPDLNAQMEYIAPDRYHIKKANGEVIVIGKDSYENDNGKWKKLDDNIGEFIKSQTTTGIEEGIKNLKDVQIVGKENINGKEATIYSHNIAGVQTKVWIENNSGRQLKNEIEASVSGQVQKQTTVYDYDKKFKIEAPEIK